MHDTRQTLSASLSLILEDAAFVFAELVEDEPEPFEGEVVEASLDYSGDRSGTMALRMTVPFALQVAEELMVSGDEDTLPEEIAGELLNIIAGHWVVEQFGERTRFHLTPPTAARRPGDALSPLPEDAAVLRTDDGDRVDLMVAA